MTFAQRVAFGRQTCDSHETRFIGGGKHGHSRHRNSPFVRLGYFGQEQLSNQLGVSVYRRQNAPSLPPGGMPGRDGTAWGWNVGKGKWKLGYLSVIACLRQLAFKINFWINRQWLLANSQRLFSVMPFCEKCAFEEPTVQLDFILA